MVYSRIFVTQSTKWHMRQQEEKQQQQDQILS